MHRHNREEFNVEDFWSEVPFFEMSISPSLFTVLMQGLLLVGLVATAHRKWRHAGMPAFSKPFGIGLFALLQFLLLGSLWQLYESGTASGLLGNVLSQNNFGEDETNIILIVVQTVLFTLSLLASVIIINVTCPNRHEYLKGRRRAEKLGLPQVPLLADEKPGWLVVLCLACIMTLTHFILLGRAIDSGIYFATRPELDVFLMPCLIFTACLIYLRAARERWFTMGFWGFLGLLWITPLLLCMILAVAGEDQAIEAIFHIGSISPPFALFEISARAHDLGVEPEEEWLRAAAMFGTIVACSIAAFLSFSQYQLRKSWDLREDSMAKEKSE